MPYSITVPDELQTRIDAFYISNSELSDAEEEGTADPEKWADNGDEARDLLAALMTLTKHCVVPDSPTIVDGDPTATSRPIQVEESVTYFFYLHPEKLPPGYDVDADPAGKVDTAVADAIGSNLGEVTVTERTIAYVVV